jgi:hypothetical protein
MGRRGPKSVSIRDLQEREQIWCANLRNARKAEPELVDDLLSAIRPEQVQDVCKRSASWFNLRVSLAQAYAISLRNLSEK